MNKFTFVEKLNILFEVTKSSYMFIIIFLALVLFGMFLLKATKKNAKLHKIIYFIFLLIILAVIIGLFHTHLLNLFDYMMNNFFIALYFPNLAIYLAAIIITNIILIVSIFSSKTSNIIKRLNIVVYIVIHYILALILTIISKNKLDIFDQESVYANSQAAALIELSSIIFMTWIVFLILYKIIYTFIIDGKQEKVKKVIIREKVKKLPANYAAAEIPSRIYQTQTNLSLVSSNQKTNPVLVQEPVIIKNIPVEEQNRIITTEFEQMLTVDDYKLLLRMLKEQREKESIALNSSKQQILRDKELELKVEREKIEEEYRIKEQQLASEKRALEEKRQAIRQNQIQIRALKEEELNREQEKFTELEMLYKGIR